MVLDLVPVLKRLFGTKPAEAEILTGLLIYCTFLVHILYSVKFLFSVDKLFLSPPHPSLQCWYCVF